MVAGRGFPFPGDSAGIVYYLTHNFEILKDPVTWLILPGSALLTATLFSVWRPLTQ